MQMRRVVSVGLLGSVLGCSDPGAVDGFATLGAADDGGSSTSGSTTGGPGDDDPTADASTSGADPTAAVTTLPPTTAADETGFDVPDPLDCVYRSTTFDAPMQELDVTDPNSDLRLSFSVPGLPDPSLVQSAVLHFDAYDADHPGEEGIIEVNGAGPYDIPADPGNDNGSSQSQVDVTGALVEGNNRIDFGPGPLDRTFYRIGAVELRVVAQVESCDAPDDTGDTGNGVQQEMHYSEAEYTGRNNWVWRCQPGFDYAYTAANAEHVPTDCEGLYAPDGSAHGTAIFHFLDVVEDDYLVEIHAYHTWNRNPNGARIIVDGVTGFVQQRSDAEGESSFETAEWGVAHLAGDVDIVLDSSQGGYASDAVSWIRITPL